MELTKTETKKQIKIFGYEPKQIIILSLVLFSMVSIMFIAIKGHSTQELYYDNQGNEMKTPEQIEAYFYKQEDVKAKERATQRRIDYLEAERQLKCEHQFI
jgi:hypothetical protein